ncbi:cathepsin L-like [Drosophila montana]|uniref:cathepsin L-like n=1 Tax=Drosophila montana TaxID=40370 RepID=UPI00313CA12F
MKATFVMVALLGLAASTQGGATYFEQPETEWDDFKYQFDKIYGDEAEEQLRMLIFQDNKKIIDAHNERWAAGEESYEMGVNQFSDMLPAEISKVIGRNDDVHPIADLEPEPHDYLNEVGDLDRQIPVKVNWTQIGAVTPVVNQGHFNNSWAFAATGAVESRQFIKSGRLVALSKQNLVDCCRVHNERTAAALICIKKMRGIDTEASYPYRGITGKCHFQRKLVGAKVKTVFQVWPGNETALAINVAKGPVAAVISQAGISNYKSGVFHNPHCGQSPDFAVLIVGYGTCKNFGDYWIIKTSLGSTWGEKGYMRLARNKQNLCGIANRAYYPELY